MQRRPIPVLDGWCRNTISLIALALFALTVLALLVIACVLPETPAWIAFTLLPTATVAAIAVVRGGRCLGEAGATSAAMSLSGRLKLAHTEEGHGATSAGSRQSG